MSIELNRTPVPELSQPDIFRPFTDIALTLSGGGFRASAYSLGCLSYLHRLRYEDKTLLERVKFIACASGGTMTGLLFSAHNHLGVPFEETYNFLRNNILTGDKILKEAARIIGDDKEWGKGTVKNRNVINAFAKAYQRMVFDNMKFDVYWSRSKATLEEVCFNASELENGRAFRFATDGVEETKEIFGNMYLRVRDNNAPCIKKLLLGDIMAASSCFPAGFEPMIFPDDFAGDKEHKKELEVNTIAAKNYDWEDYELFGRSFALMDGGITDNQGIESLRLANERRKTRSGRGFDLILICDVANYFMEPFEPEPEVKSWWGKISFRTVIKVHKYASVVFAVSLVMIFTSTWAGFAGIMAAVSGIMFGLYVIGRREAGKRNGVAGVNNGKGNHSSRWGLPVGLFMDFLLSSPLSKTELMLKARVKSALRVAMEIYLLQIRRINYDSLYTDREWAYKTKAVSIYELSKSNENVLQRQFKRKQLGDDIINLLTPSEPVMSIAEYARQMSTTLWFAEEGATKEKNIRDALIATGQFTLCYNLIEYIIQVENKYPELLKDEGIQTLKKQLLDDWKLFQKEPMCMVSEELGDRK